VRPGGQRHGHMTEMASRQPNGPAFGEMRLLLTVNAGG
jgi:hypothetical protein